MNDLKINEQIAFLRKQKGMTQEELAHSLGVTNQSVSKWESAQCCPDIQLLPELAKIFDVSIDELMGYKAAESMPDIYLKIKALFESIPREDIFDNAFRLCALLHEAAMTGGYKERVPWNTDMNHALGEDLYKWGFSACSLPEGNTVHTGNGLFIADGRHYHAPTASQIMDLYVSLDRLCDLNVLKIMYSLYEMTVNDFDLYVPISEIAKKAKMSEAETEKALEQIPVTVKDGENGDYLYRIEGSYMHMPSLLLLLRQR
ncbi:MAG: helix-turn-helix transcriptional regulator [Oscillospiraceae bacterium]|nr:helix-turn-helix transcriptional regulator [Oscillospiraceae bacterium]